MRNGIALGAAGLAVIGLAACQGSKPHTAVSSAAAGGRAVGHALATNHALQQSEFNALRQLEKCTSKLAGITYTVTNNPQDPIKLGHISLAAMGHLASHPKTEFLRVVGCNKPPAARAAIKACVKQITPDFTHGSHQMVISFAVDTAKCYDGEPQ